MQFGRWTFSMLLVVCLGLAAVPYGAPQEGRGKAEEEIRQLSAAEVAAFLKRDSAALARLWSEDFVVTNPLNQFVTKKQVLGMVDSGFLIITSFDRQLDYLKVYGDTAIVAGRENQARGRRPRRTRVSASVGGVPGSANRDRCHRGCVRASQ
jgi:ketosteroid isomerase-like protein